MTKNTTLRCCLAMRSIVPTIVLLLLQQQAFFATAADTICYLTNQPVQTLSRSDTGNFFAIDVEALKDGTTTPAVRLLASDADTDEAVAKAASLSSISHLRGLTPLTEPTSELDDDGYFYGRHCHCFDQPQRELVFCPPTIRTCEQSSGGVVSCVSGPHSSIRINFFAAVFIFFCLAVTLIATPWGGNAVGYMINLTCHSNWNGNVVDRMMAGNAPRAHYLVDAYQIDLEEKLKTSRLVIQTEIYKEEESTPSNARVAYAESDTTSDSGSDTIPECTICMLDLKPGDRVASLSCRHVFHSSCVGQWARRRNACPLCQKIIAVPLLEKVESTPKK